MQRLINTGFTAFTRKTSQVDMSSAATEDNDAHDHLVYEDLLTGSHCTLTTEDLTWITDTLRAVTDRDGCGGAQKSEGQKWQRKQFFRTMIHAERVLASRVARYAQRQLDEVVRFGAVLDTEEKVPLIQECKRKFAHRYSSLLISEYSISHNIAQGKVSNC